MMLMGSLIETKYIPKTAQDNYTIISINIVYIDTILHYTIIRGQDQLEREKERKICFEKEKYFAIKKENKAFY